MPSRGVYGSREREKRTVGAGVGPRASPCDINVRVRRTFKPAASGLQITGWSISRITSECKAVATRGKAEMQAGADANLLPTWPRPLTHGFYSHHAMMELLGCGIRKSDERGLASDIGR